MTAPRLVYDDDCGFCTWCAVVARERTDVVPVGFSELTPALRARLPEGYETCVHLLTDDAVYSCGAAVERTLARIHPALSGLFALLRRVPGYPTIRERLYRWGAERRDLWGKVVRARPPA
jgi:predicted DCC family thiol-disulfide oxidoreductase YuxK